MNLLLVLDEGDNVLIATFLILVTMSAISWYLIFFKSYVLWRERRRFTQRQGHAATLEDTARTHAGAPAELHRLSLLQALDMIRLKLDSGLSILASIGSTAPFIGLFGTVWGIYHALSRIAAEGNASLDTVAGPIGEALIATAIGLFAAIPATLAYNGFLRVNRVLLLELRHVAERLSASHGA